MIVRPLCTALVREFQDTAFNVLVEQLVRAVQRCLDGRSFQGLSLPGKGHDLRNGLVIVRAGHPPGLEILHALSPDP